MNEKTISIVVDKFLPPKVRIIVYYVCALACLVLVIIGKISEDTAGTWLLFAAGVLGVSSSGLAIANRPKAAVTTNVKENDG